MVRLNGQLETQLQENEMVKEELNFCKEDSRVFKLVGDVLIPQTLEEAKSNVLRRIEYIQNESYVYNFINSICKFYVDFKI